MQLLGESLDLHAVEKKIYIYFISGSKDSWFVTPLGFRLERRHEKVNKAMFALYRINSRAGTKTIPCKASVYT